MEKKFYKSKTFWGLFIAGIITLLNIWGVEVGTSTIDNSLQIIGGLLTAWGIRSAID